MKTPINPMLRMLIRKAPVASFKCELDGKVMASDSVAKSEHEIIDVIEGWLGKYGDRISLSFSYVK